MSKPIAKLFKNPLALAGAALVLHIGAASAADPNFDAQQQARELLTGTASAHVAPRSAPRDRKETGPTADAQEMARQLLLGASVARAEGAVATRRMELARVSGEPARQARLVAYGDPQAAARQLLLGQPVASDAAGSVAR
jgi:hypothetical protein